jgi:HPr kinase/phosphorylase
MLYHASCVAIGGKAVLITGPSGSGKSDLALRLIDEGAQLVSDDQTILRCEKEILLASPAPTIAGMSEIRQLGLVKMDFVMDVPVALLVELTGADETLDRLPEDTAVFLLDQRVQRLRLRSFYASTPAKIRAALNHALL